MEISLLKAAENITAYFKEHLPQYTVLGVERKSKHPDDAHIYMVAARKSDGSYGFWSCWNGEKGTLNHGHYGIGSLEACGKLMEEYRNDSRYFTVYRYSHRMKDPLLTVESEEEAERFCREHGWELEDENGFVWSLDYRQAY